ncbi:YihY/virulence factor BrkB family protein [Arthrobacter sp. RAF14]|uniref:YihY/virulence factor BrkB family protein n=1 Tax=Arthrobacter sp. RAF14 TaxID=3233051 RepID=UPI003F933F14
MGHRKRAEAPETRPEPLPEDPVGEDVSPLDRAGLRREERRRRDALWRGFSQGQGTPAFLGAFFAWLAALSATWLPLRVWGNFQARNGSLVAGGVAFRMFFSIGALTVAGFGIGGLLLNGHPGFRDDLLNTAAKALPGVLKRGDGPGLIDPQGFLDPGGLSWTVALSLVVALFSSLGWIGGTREGMRQVAVQPPLKENFVVARLLDLATLLLMALALLLSVGITVLSSDLLGHLLAGTPFEQVVRIPFLAIAAGLLLNGCTAALLMRLGARLRFPRRPFLEGVAICAVILTLMQALSSELLGMATKNPVMASFGIVVGVLIWLNLLSMVLLLCTSWTTVRAADLEAAADGQARDEA